MADTSPTEVRRQAKSWATIVQKRHERMISHEDLGAIRAANPKGDNQIFLNVQNMQANLRSSIKHDLVRKAALASEVLAWPEVKDRIDVVVVYKNHLQRFIDGKDSRVLIDAPEPTRTKATRRKDPATEAKRIAKTALSSCQASDDPAAWAAAFREGMKGFGKDNQSVAPEVSGNQPTRPVCPPDSVSSLGKRKHTSDGSSDNIRVIDSVIDNVKVKKEVDKGNISTRRALENIDLSLAEIKRKLKSAQGPP